MPTTPRSITKLIFTNTMLPFALCFMVAGVSMTAAWVAFDWPLGPGASVHYVPPGQ